MSRRAQPCIRAAELFEDEAQVLRDSYTVGGEWPESEAETREYYEGLLSLAGELRAASACNCWQRVNALIKQGDLPGNGCDETAERNGLILAANAILRADDAPANAPYFGNEP